jgi:predicted phosphodiesterase
MKLWAISDLHVGYAENRDFLAALPPHPDDWLILGGDLGESEDHLRFVFETLLPRFARLLWVPGNHELWSMPNQDMLRGEAKYLQLVALCQKYGVLTPEDPYPIFDDGQARHLLAPLFVLYDYTFAPDHYTADQALAWAQESGLQCADEFVLHPDPYPTRSAWCAARCAYSESRLTEALRTHDGPTVLINHFPLLQRLAVLPAIPRFSIWCGTRRTEDWPRRFRAEVLVYGHLHLPQTRFLDTVRCEEVSLGYPRQWKSSRASALRMRPPPALRQILPPRRPEAAGPGFERYLP